MYQVQALLFLLIISNKRLNMYITEAIFLASILMTSSTEFLKSDASVHNFVKFEVSKYIDYKMVICYKPDSMAEPGIKLECRRVPKIVYKSFLNEALNNKWKLGFIKRLSINSTESYTSHLFTISGIICKFKRWKKLYCDNNYLNSTVNSTENGGFCNVYDWHRRNMYFCETELLKFVFYTTKNSLRLKDVINVSISHFLGYYGRYCDKNLQCGMNSSCLLNLCSCFDEATRTIRLGYNSVKMKKNEPGYCTRTMEVWRKRKFCFSDEICFSLNRCMKCRNNRCHLDTNRVKQGCRLNKTLGNSCDNLFQCYNSNSGNLGCYNKTCSCKTGLEADGKFQCVLPVKSDSNLGTILLWIGIGIVCAAFVISIILLRIRRAV